MIKHDNKIFRTVPLLRERTSTNWDGWLLLLYSHYMNDRHPIIPENGHESKPYEALGSGVLLLLN